MFNKIFVLVLSVVSVTSALAAFDPGVPKMRFGCGSVVGTGGGTVQCAGEVATSQATSVVPLGGGSRNLTDNNYYVLYSKNQTNTAATLAAYRVTSGKTLVCPSIQVNANTSGKVIMCHSPAAPTNDTSGPSGASGTNKTCYAADGSTATDGGQILDGTVPSTGLYYRQYHNWFMAPSQEYVFFKAKDVTGGGILIVNTECIEL